MVVHVPVLPLGERLEHDGHGVGGCPLPFEHRPVQNGADPPSHGGRLDELALVCDGYRTPLTWRVSTWPTGTRPSFGSAWRSIVLRQCRAVGLPVFHRLRCSWKVACSASAKVLTMRHDFNPLIGWVSRKARLDRPYVIEGRGQVVGAAYS